MLPAGADRFLRNTIRSIWDLELLLLLRAYRARLWTVDDLVRELRASVLIVADALGSLQKAGLVSKSGNETYQFWPISPELDQLVAEVAAIYASAPAAVTEAILSAPSANIRIFADAFKIKKD